MADGPFTRAAPRSSTNKEDSEGKVNVLIQRVDKGSPVKGNISRAFTIERAKVSDVARLLERTLFGEG